MKLYENYSGRHSSHLPDPEKINRIAEKSFKILHSDEIQEKESLVSKILEFIYSNFKPLALTAAAAALAVVLYNSSYDPIENNSADNNVSTDNAENIESVQDTFSFNGVKKSGEKFKNAVATIETVSDTYLESVSESEVKMNSGKAKFEVISGNDFRINVSDKFLVRVLGTVFTLEYNGSDFKVDVSEGLVEIINRFDNSSVALSANMYKVFPVSTVNVEKTIAISKLKNRKNISMPKLAITPDASFLTQGREALKSGNTGAAVQLFILEMEKGKEKDKALFEAVRIHEGKGSLQDVINLISSKQDILKTSKVYKEELLIKGCLSQYKIKTDNLSFCKEYIESFPSGYRRTEVLEIINEK